MSISPQNVGFPTSMLTLGVFNLLNWGNLLDEKTNGFSILIRISLIICEVKHVYTQIYWSFVFGCP